MVVVAAQAVTGLVTGAADILHEQVAAPGADVRLFELAPTREERRHLDTSLPFMLEESLAEDIEGLHFARRESAPGQLSVAVVSRARMAQWQEQLGEFAALPNWVPEPLLLPWEAGQWTLVLEPQQALLRYGACAGTTLEPDLLPALLTALAAEADPEALVVYGADEARDLELLPPELRPRAQWRRGGLGDALLLSAAAGPLLNLRQGDFAPRLPLERWWRQWRAVAALLLVAVAAHLLAGWLDLRSLRAENLALRAEIERIYRDVNPRGAVVDAEKQLRRQLEALGGAESTARFASLLEPLGRLIAAQQGTMLASLNYNQRSGELRVNLIAPDFAAVESIRAGLVAAGQVAALENSSRSGDRVRARLTLQAEPT